MTNRRTTLLTFSAALFVTLLLPLMTASAQGGYDPWWGRGRDRNRDDRYYGHDRRALRDAIRRVEDRSEDFEDHLDRALDRSRYDDSRREDRINDAARQFRDASRRLKDRYSDRDLNRSANEARTLLQIGSRIDQFMSRQRLDSRTVSEWNQIRYDLRVIADAYGYRTRDYDRGRGDRRGSNDRGWQWPF